MRDILNQPVISGHTDKNYKPALTGRDPQGHRRISEFEMPVRSQLVTDIYVKRTC
jgi:hypothetical protein